MSAPRSHRVLIAGRPLTISLHAMERYRERVRPSLEYRQVVVELVAVLRFAEVTEAPPAWVRFIPEEKVPDEWVVLNESIAFPVAGGRLMTCVTRAGDTVHRRRVERKTRRRKIKGERQDLKGKAKAQERRRYHERRDKFDGRSAA